MHLPKLIGDLAVILLTAGVVTLLFKKIKQPLVLGYIAAGFLIGPYMPFFFTVEDMSSVSTWSEIGIIILMFALGLEFNLHKLMKVGGTGVITALTEVGGMLLLGFVTGQLMGWDVMDSVFLGAMLSMSSTTIIIKAFDELGVSKRSFAELVFGTLVIEDIAGIFMMIIFSTLSVSRDVSGGELAVTLGLMVLYLALWLLLGIFLLPTALQKASPLMSDETLLIVSLGICFGMVLLANALGFSSALGAFLAGSLLAGTVHAERVEHLTASIKDLFGSVFFISVGMMLEPAKIAQYIVPIAIITCVTVLGKLMISSLGVLLSGESLHNAIHCGCSLAQIGEFAFIIASLGMSLGVIADYIYPIIVSVSIITTLTTPFFIRKADGVERLILRLLPEKLKKRLARLTAESGDKENDGDWQLYIRSFLERTALYGTIMLGIVLMGQYLLYPALTKALDARLAAWAALGTIYLVMALFIRPMMDTKNARYTALWMKNRLYHLPLRAMTLLRLGIIVFLAFLPLRTLAGISSLWLLPLIAAVVLLLRKSRFLASRYLNVEARFLTNLNERLLPAEEDDVWLDKNYYVLRLKMGEEDDGKTLTELAWGHDFGVNAIKLIRGEEHLNIPGAGEKVYAGEKVFVIGEMEGLRNLCLSRSLPLPEELPTLHDFVAREYDRDTDLYAYILAVEKDSPLAGELICSSGLRETHDCMILGLQRHRLPILRPDVNMEIQADDVIWLLGTRDSAKRLLAEDYT